MLERHKAFLRFFPCRAKKFPAIRYTPRACPGPGWGKRPIPSYPCGAIYSSLRGEYPLRPTAYGARLRRGLFGRPSGYFYSLWGESPLRLRLRGRRKRRDGGTAPVQRLLWSFPTPGGSKGRLAAEGGACREAARPRPQAGTPCRPTVRRERGRCVCLSGCTGCPMAPQAAPFIRHTSVGDRGYGLLSGSRCTAPGT